MTLIESTSNFLGFFQQRRALRIAIAAFIILFMANLDSLVSLITRPEVPYFDQDHLIVGAVAGFVAMVFFGIMAVYLGSLERALRDVKTLKGLLPICSSCSKIRTPDDKWHMIEKYIAERTDATFTHGLCPECARKLYGEMADQFGKK